MRSNLVTCVIAAALITPAWAAPTEEELQARVQRMYPPPQDTTPSELKAIDNEIAANNPEAAFDLATKVLERPEPTIGRQRQAYIRSLAFVRRAQARRILGQGDAQVNQDVLEAARLGNLAAINSLVRRYVDSAKKSGPDSAVPLAGVDMDEVIDVGLYLEDVPTIRAALDGYYKKGMSPSFRAFYELLFAYRTKDSGLLNRLRSWNQKLDVGSTLREHALVGGPLTKTKTRPFDRDILATLSAESNLRGTLARGLGVTLPEVRPSRELSLREILEVTAWVGEMSGLSTLYQLTSQETSLAHSVSLSRSDLGAQVAIGDTIHVRCGGLAHTAVVFGVSAERDELLLADPLLQFWQPTHNTCVSAFEEVHHRYGYYFARVRLSEVTPILDAVQKFGSFSLPEFTQNIDVFGTRLPPISQPCGTATTSKQGFLDSPLQSITARDFFTFFNLREWKREVSGHDTAVFFLPAAPEFRGDIIVTARIDATSCVREFSTILRRSFVDSSRRPFAMDVIRSFFNQGIGQENSVALLGAKSVLIGSKTSAEGGIRDVLAGNADGVVLQVPGVTLHVGNATAETGARWIRMDVR